MIGLLILVFFFFISFHNFYWKRRKLPPGPTPWPLVGNIISMLSNAPDDMYIKWRKQFGDVYTYWNGESPVVAVCGYETIMDTFVKDGESYTGRPDSNEFLEVIKNGRTGVVFTDGDPWKDHRRFALTVLRNLGLGKNTMQNKILDELAVTIKRINEQRKSGILYQDIGKHIDLTISSVISSLVFGFSYTGDSEKTKDFERIKISLNKIEDDFGHPLTFILFGKAHRYKHFPVIGDLYASFTKHKNIVFELLQKIVDTKRKEINLEDANEPNDYVEAFLVKQHELEKKNIKDHNFT